MKYLAPETHISAFSGDEATVFTHDAYGMIGMSIVTGGDGVLYGSDLKHGQQVRIRIKRAQTQRLHANDWFQGGDEIIEVSLSHSQFAEFITSPNRGDGIPCTINYGPERGTSCKPMPGILPIESKAQMMRQEIRDSAKAQMAKVSESLAKIEKMMEEGTIGKKALKDAVFNLKCHVENTPSNMAHVVEQSERTLEKAVTSAKIDVEAYINSAINKLGIQAANNLGLTEHSAQGFLTNEDK